METHQIVRKQKDRFSNAPERKEDVQACEIRHELKHDGGLSVVIDGCITGRYDIQLASSEIVASERRFPNRLKYLAADLVAAIF